MKLDKQKRADFMAGLDSASNRTPIAAEALRYLRKLDPDVLPIMWQALTEGVAEENIRAERLAAVQRCVALLERLANDRADSMSDTEIVELAWFVRDSSPPDDALIRSTMVGVIAALVDAGPIATDLAEALRGMRGAAGGTIQ